MKPTEEEFLEWRQSHVAKFFFDEVERQLRGQMLEQQLQSLHDKTVDQVALATAETRGYVAGVLAVSAVEYNDL
jgi:heme oxygenase